MADETPPGDPAGGGPGNIENCALRWGLLTFGWLNVGLGLIGIVVPGMPTTVFLIVALWAFSRSSERFQRWLWDHPRLGPPIRDWHTHRVISPRAKAVAAAMMTASFVYVTFFVAETWVGPALLAAVLIPAAAYVLSRASQPPQENA